MRFLRAEFALEKRADLVALQVHARKDEVIRRLVQELLDELSKITLDDFIARSFERGIEVNLFTSHRLRLNDRMDALLLG